MEQHETTETVTQPEPNARIATREFARRLARLGIADEGQLYRAVEEFPKEKREDLGALLEVLFEKGLITPWQAEQIASYESPLLTIGGYRLLAKLGEGLRGTVYLARFPQRDQVVALKVYRKRQFEEEDAVKARLQKAKSLCRLEHPNVVSTYDVGIDRGYIFQAMEFVGGQDLGSRVVMHGRMSIPDALRYLTQIASGVEYLHQQRLVHGNLKPQNIIITADRGIKLLDVLLAPLDPPIPPDTSMPSERTLTSHLTSRFGELEAPGNAILEALAFLAPEQLRVPPFDDVRSDIYAMGSLFFYMLTGDHLFAASTPEEMLARKLKGSAPTIESARPDLPRDLRDALTQTIASDPTGRYPSTTLLLRTLERERENLVGSDRTSESGDFMRNASSGRLTAVEQAKKQLEDLGLVRPLEWEKAVQQSGGSHNVTRILTELMTMRSTHTWRIEGGAPPILTKFQFDLISSNQANRLRLRDYILRDRLGENGPITVDKALNVRLERIDILHSFPRFHGRNRDNMLEKVKVLREIEHPNLVRVYDQLREDPFDIIAVEYVEGQDLRTHMEANYVSRGRTLGWRAALQWAIALASALRDAHAMEVRHGNIRPSKIMITYAGVPKILDMGFGQLLGFTRGNPYAPTPAVMAPEQWLDSTEVTIASDLYNLGCTLFYLFTSSMPFRAKSLSELRRGHSHTPSPKVTDSRPDIPPAVDEIIGRLLAKNPAERYSHAGAVVADLQAVLGEQPAEPPPVINAAKPEPEPEVATPHQNDDGPSFVSLFVALVVIASAILAIVYFFT